MPLLANTAVSSGLTAPEILLPEVRDPAFGGRARERDMDYTLAIITQDRGLEKVMQRISKYFGCELKLCENCEDFIKDFGGSALGVVVIDGSICSQPRLMDLQMVLNEAPAWQVVYLPRTNKKKEIKDAMGFGAFGCLHKPVSEQEVRQMVQSAVGI